MKKITKYIVWIIAALIIIGSILSLLTNTDSRYLKMLDFPRIQFAITGVLMFILLMVIENNKSKRTYVLAIFLIGSIILQGTYLINYTPLANKEVADATKDRRQSQNQFSVMIANVQMENKTYQPLLDLIENKNPDILLAMEVTDWWNEKLKPVAQRYPYGEEVIYQNGYGMTLYSKILLETVDVNYLNNDKVPSFTSTVLLPSGKQFKLHTMHPPPPLYYKEIPDNENQEEQAMLIVGDKVMSNALPDLVMGDFNDVAWSKTNQMTKARGTLNDVRVGRGFYNSYHAERWWMRWPLDHIFVTEEFSLISLERLPNSGSDHFPIYAELQLE